MSVLWVLQSLWSGWRFISHSCGIISGQASYCIKMQESRNIVTRVMSWLKFTLLDFMNSKAPQPTIVFICFLLESYTAIFHHLYDMVPNCLLLLLNQELLSVSSVFNKEKCYSSRFLLSVQRQQIAVSAGNYLSQSKQ